MADRTFNRNPDPQLRHRLGRFFQDGRNIPAISTAVIAEAGLPPVAGSSDTPARTAVSAAIPVVGMFATTEAGD